MMHSGTLQFLFLAYPTLYWTNFVQFTLRIAGVIKRLNTQNASNTSNFHLENMVENGLIRYLIQSELRKLIQLIG